MTQQPRLLHDLLSEQARSEPDRPALHFDGSTLSYAQLHKLVVVLAECIAATGEPGDRIGVLAWNHPEYVAMLYAVPRAGRVLVPLNSRLAPAELAAQIQRAGIGLLFADGDLLRRLETGASLPDALRCIRFGTDFLGALPPTASTIMPEVLPEATAWLLYTSGTTGQPKGAMLSHRSILAGLVSAASGRPVDSQDVYLYPFPLFHVSAHNVLLQHKHGAAVLLVASFDADEVLTCCREQGVTTMSLAPTMVRMLIDNPGFKWSDLAAIRTIGYGASAMPSALLQRLCQGCTVGLSGGYGMTELSGSVAFLDVAGHRRAVSEAPGLLASVGKLVPGVEARLVTSDGEEVSSGGKGEILIRGAQLMLGYWGDAPGTAAVIVDGWLHTGDIGRFDAEGNLYIVDRLKDMVLSGGENVASREVEEVLLAHPGVSDVAVVGLPDAQWGEAVCALVVLKLTSQHPEDELIGHCRGLLAGYKTPKFIRFSSSLPVNASGKIDKPAVREYLASTR
ncbi:MAG: acyl-CoA synthetase (AMP-forming)/AMP-acid ligase II [Halieaceae bacterium]|jgi:acyl-CoA synthetase (AMP-forming)/AMP-acid ligase II